MIPRIAHFIWLGPEPLPAYGERNIARFRELHPEWDVRIHRQDDGHSPERGNWAMRADLLRLLLLRRLGGVYLDLDMEVQKPLDALLACREGAFVGCVDDGGRKLNNAVIGAIPHHPAVSSLLSALPPWWERQIVIGTSPGNAAKLTGPAPMTAFWLKDDRVAKLPRFYFYPYGVTEPWRADEEFPDSYAVHRWAGSWLDNLTPAEQLSFTQKKLRKALAEIKRLKAL